jgi:hypothetical protein
MPQASKKATSKKFKHGKRGEAQARVTIEGDLQESELEEERRMSKMHIELKKDCCMFKPNKTWANLTGGS